MRTKFRSIRVHIGLHKTGSTTFQEGLSANRGSLMDECGVYLPDGDANHSTVLFGAFCDRPERYQENILAGLTDAHAARQAGMERLRGLEQQFAESDLEHAVLSAENLSLLKPADVKRFEKWLSTWADDIRIVAVVRDPLSWAASCIPQQVRGGRVLEHLLDSPPRQDAKRKLAAFADVFGRSRITVARFEDLLSEEGGLFPSLCDRMGVSREWAVRMGVAPVGVGYAREATELISALNEARPLFVKGERGPGRSRGDEVVFGVVDGDKLKLPKRTQRRVLRDAADDIAYLKEAFGVELSVPGTLETPKRERRFRLRTLKSIATSWRDLHQEREMLRFQIWAYQKLVDGKYEDARAMIERVREIGPDDPATAHLESRLDALSSQPQSEKTRAKRKLRKIFDG